MRINRWRELVACDLSAKASWKLTPLLALRRRMAHTVEMESQRNWPVSTLLLVPTELELKLLEPYLPGTRSTAAIELCGFGPVAAAARTARLIEAKRPARIILAGIAGTFSANALPVGAACCFRRVALDGVGVGESSRFVSAVDLGFAQSGIPSDELKLETIGDRQPEDLLLTCCAASDSAGMAAERKSRHPAAIAEDMEGFGVALACHFAGVSLTVLRGISNVVGNRDKNSWDVENAIRAVGDLLRQATAKDSETGIQE